MSRSPLSKTPKQVFFNPIHILTLLPHFFSYYYYKFTFFISTSIFSIFITGKGGFGAKIVRLLKDSALIGSQAIGLVMSKQIAWSFAQAFVADDELTSQGDSDFMKYGVSLAALVSI